MNSKAVEIMEAIDTFLKQNGVELQSSIDEMIADGINPIENDVVLYGTDYGNLMSTITTIIER